MNDKKIMKTSILRPLLLVSAVGFACQKLAIAQTYTAQDTPFAPRPLHLQNTSTSTGAVGVKPNVMFFIDDSGSMQGLVGGRTETNNPQDSALRNSDRGAWNALVNNNYANPVPCSFSAATLGTNNNCYYINWPHWGFYSFRQQNNRIRVTIDALNAVVDKYQDDWRWNIYTLWGSETRAARGGRTPRNQGRYSWWPTAHNFMSAAEMKNLVNALSPTGATPTTSRYVEVARIMRNNIEYRCQKSYIVLMSDGDANQLGIPANFQPWENALYGSFTGRTNADQWGGNNRWETWTRTHNNAITQYQPYRSGSTNGISLFSQILANADLKGENDRVGAGPQGRDREGGYWNRNTDDPNPVYHNTTDTQQTIQTFTVGFGEGLSSNGRGYLRDAATCNEPKDGKCFFTPNTGAELAEAFEIISASIAADNQPGAIQTHSTSAPAAASASIPELAATLSLDTGSWSSVLRFHPLQASGAPIPGATPVEADYSSRRVLVNNGTDTYWLNNSTPATRNVDFNIATGQEFTRAFIPWLTRTGTVQDPVAGVTDANRTVKKYRPTVSMSDVLDTPITALVREAGSRQKYVMTAANDGMLYFFRSTGASGATAAPYRLIMNYLPAGMQRESSDGSLTVGKAIPRIADEGYGESENNSHLYLNNGGMSWVETPSTLPQEYVMIGTMGQGGRGAYALSIGGRSRADRNGATPAGLDAAESSWISSVPMWETEKGSANMLGYTVGSPQLAPVMTEIDPTTRERSLKRGVRVAAFMGNGYQGKNLSIPYDSSPSLYVYDMMGQEFGSDVVGDNRASVISGAGRGSLIRKIEVGTDTNSGAPAGALSSPRLLDNNLDGVADFAYAGDQYGNLYRFDLRGTPSEWKVNKIYKGDPTQPITVSPALHRIEQDKYVVIFGTGSDLFENDRIDTNQQIIMGIHDDLTDDNPTILTPTSRNIVDRQFTSTSNRRSLPAALPFASTNKAWRIRLNQGQVNGNNVRSSEKVVTDPVMLLGTAVINSRIYDYSSSASTLPNTANAAQTCFSTSTRIRSGGSSWQMFIDAETGSFANKDKGGFLTDDDGNPIAGLGYDNILSGNTIIGTDESAYLVGGDGSLRRGGRIHLDQGGGEENPIKDQRTDCLPVGATPQVLAALSGADATLNPNDTGLVSISVDAPRCVVKMIRANWREVPL